jgi:hypothetical protein
MVMIADASAHSCHVANNTMRRKTILTALAAIAIAIVIVCAYTAYRLLAIDLVSAHQQSITREIATWGETYSKIQGPEEDG